MKTVKIDKNSKLIKFLTANENSDRLFGVFPWRPKPYGTSRKPLPTDTCSLRKALILHGLSCIIPLTIWTTGISIIAIILLSALIVTPYEFFTGCLFQVNSVPSVAGFGAWLLIIIFTVSIVFVKSIFVIIGLFKKLNIREKENGTKSVFAIIYYSVKNKLCSKIEYVNDKEQK